MKDPVVDLTICSSVVYEGKNHVPGVNFKTAENQKGWTPVVKKNYEAKKPMDKGDGSKSNPVRSCDDELWLGSAKEIKYTQLNGTPGLTYRKGKTNHSYQWIPIMPDSPVATRTRVKLKNSVQCNVVS